MSVVYIVSRCLKTLACFHYFFSFFLFSFLFTNAPKLVNCCSKDPNCPYTPMYWQYISGKVLRTGLAFQIKKFRGLRMKKENRLGKDLVEVRWTLMYAFNFNKINLNLNVTDIWKSQYRTNSMSSSDSTTEGIGV